MNSQYFNTIIVASDSHKSTIQAGFALSASLYRKDILITLSGELGAGKTAFVQGLGLGLGIDDAITSPTYAIENRYGSTHSPKTDDVLMHLDLYRLDPKEACRIVDETDDFPGIRAVEWSERLKEEKEEKEQNETHSFYSFSSFHSCSTSHPTIEVDIHESSPTSRTITITFADLPLPSRKEIEAWRTEVQLPEHIARHCDAVGKFGKTLAEELVRRGTVCRPEAVRVAGELHDLLRFIDFPKEEQKTNALWISFIQQYPHMHHEEACAQFVTNHGYPELATIIKTHGLRTVDEPKAFTTIEQKILCYADKRLKIDTIVSLDQRFDDFITRYGHGEESEEAKRWRRKTKELEEELFGTDIP